MWRNDRGTLEVKPELMSWIRRALLIFGAIILLVMGLGAHYYFKGFSSIAVRRGREASRRPVEVAEYRRLDRQLADLRVFAVGHGYNTQMAFLVDMGLPSGKYRFFVADLDKDSVVLAGLVAHGCGNRRFAVHPDFSNIDGSSCTSLGRYWIGAGYSGRFGRAYRLYGLDSSNSQAFRRNVVLHSFSYVPEAETDPLPICNSRGCPMVSEGFLRQLEPLIDRSSRPILLWIFD
jgi:hypothetical protein